MLVPSNVGAIRFRFVSPAAAVAQSLFRFRFPIPGNHRQFSEVVPAGFFFLFQGADLACSRRGFGQRNALSNYA